MKALLVAFLVAAPAFAAEEPEAVYAKFHKAGLDANFAEMRKWGTAKKGEEMATMPQSLQGPMLRMLASLLPKTYRVESRSVETARATLNLSAKQEQGTVHGVVTLLREQGEWKVDQAKWGEPKPVALKAAVIAPGAAQGTVNGVAFRVEKAELRSGILELRQGSDFFADRSFVVFLFLQGKPADGRRFVVGSGGDDFGSPHIHLKYKVAGENLPKTEMFMSKYQMTLEFGARNGNRIPGRIDLRTPDKAGSFVSGTFEAEIK